MPRGDMTGPAGLGPMTGRGAGYCAGFNTPGYMNPYGGRGYFGGRGRGFRNWYRATGLPGWQRANMGLPAWGGWGYYPPAYSPATPYQPTPTQEKEMLTEELKVFKEEMKAIGEGMKAIEKRIQELETKKKK